MTGDWLERAGGREIKKLLLDFALLDSLVNHGIDWDSRMRNGIRNLDKDVQVWSAESRFKIGGIAPGNFGQIINFALGKSNRIALTFQDYWHIGLG